jgi:hypothetical protein
MKLFLAGLLALSVLVVPALAAEGSGSGGTSKLRHVVSFKFKDTASKDQIQEVVEAFRALPSKIPEIVAFEWGTNVSPENLNKGFTHAFILTFKTDKDRDVYLVHPAHKAFGGIVGPVLADVFVVDFQARE